MSDQIKPTHYCTHAIDDLQKWHKMLSKYAPRSATVLEGVLRLLDQSVKFLLPNGCEIVDPYQIKQSHIDLARLPYPCVAFEAPFERDDGIVQIGAFQQQPATRRIALCWEALPEYEVIPGLYSILEHFPGGGVFVVPIYWGPKNPQWTVALGGSFFPYDNQLIKRPQSQAPEISRITNTALIEAGLGKHSTKEYLSEPFFLFPEIFETAVHKYGSVEQAYAQISLDSRDETMMLIQACSVLNCANVTTETIPAPSQLNRKRVAKGKQPFYTYKVLQLSEQAGSKRGASAGGTHASPRMHLRRGHIRRLDDRMIWVKPAMVNAESPAGRVEKDYQIVTNAPPNT